MVTPVSLKITRFHYEEPHNLHLRIEASNGRQRSEIEFYVNAIVLIKWAENLETFPKQATHVYLWEQGSERSEDKWAYYLRLRAITTDTTGHCAIHLRFNNNEALPHREISEFCIRAEAGAVNRLGRLCREFSQLEHEVLMWTPLEGKLFRTIADVDFV